MIVEDEPALRKALINVINWESLNCSIAYETEDGIDALEKLSDVNPDIIITNARTPDIEGMDGMSLAKRIYEDRLPVKVILLTGQADFEFARKAIEYDVVDFVLKPTTESIVTAVDKAKARIVHEQETNGRLKEMEDLFFESTLHSVENELRELIDGIKDSPEDLEGLIKQLNITMKSFCMMVFEIDCDLTNNNKKNWDLLTLKNIISLAFKEITYFTVTLKPDKLCLLALFNEGDILSGSKETVLSICEEIIEISENFMDYSTFIGLSHIHNNFSRIRSAYNEAEDSLVHKFYDNSKNTVHMPYSKSTDRFDPFMLHSSIDKIVSNLQKAQGDEALEELKKLFDSIREKEYPVSEIKNSGVLLCSLISRHLSNYRVDMARIMGNDIDNIYRSILESKTITSLYETLSKAITSAADYLNSGEVRHNSIITNARKFLNDNYNKDISLKDIAAHVHVNSSYLSRLFRKETGETITEVLTRIRIEKAKEMLTLTNKKSYEIAGMVGIDDPVYFSQLFKKYTHLNPKDYRRLSRST